MALVGCDDGVPKKVFMLRITVIPGIGGIFFGFDRDVLYKRVKRYYNNE